jgi:Protein of unknown function (DUF3040)
MVMTQAEIEAKIENLDRQMMRLLAEQQRRNRRRFWIGGASILLALGYLFAGAITSIGGLGLAGIPLLFVGLALYGSEMEKNAAWPTSDVK